MSATSSPAGSPSSRAYASPSPRRSPGIDLTMTPKTRVARMLAAMSDSDSDEPAPRPNLRSSPKQQSSPQKDRTMADSMDEDDEDDVPVARHRARPNKKAIDSEDDDIDMADAGAPESKTSAADRLRQQLFGPRAQEKEAIPDKEDEDETPKPARRRILKKKSSPIRSPSASKAASPRPDAVSEEEGNTIAKSKKLQKKKKGTESKEKNGIKSKKSKKQAPIKSASGSEATAQGSDSDDGSIGSLDEDDSLEALFEESKLMRLVNEKRKAAEEKEAVEEAKRKAGSEASQLMEEEDMDSIFSDASDAGGNKRAKAKRPSLRKASKKAEFEMRAETQRMARNQNLQLPAPKKKVLPVADLWAIFGATNPNPPKSQTNSAASPIPPTSEVEQSTPPSSLTESPNTKSVVDAQSQQHDKKQNTALKNDDDMPSLEQLMQESYSPKEDAKGKGKEKVITQDVNMLDIPTNRKLGFAAIPKFDNAKKSTVSFAKIPSASHSSDSDSDLEILPPPAVKPVPKSDPLRDLRKFARLDYQDSERTNRKGKGPVKNPNWQQDLLKKARDQIKADEEEKKDALRAQGFEVLTEEEKVREALITEDLVEQARQEAREQKERERREEARQKGIRLADLSDDSDEDDGDYDGSGADDSEGEVELSGSESEAESEGSIDEEMKDQTETVEIPGTPASAQRPSSPIRLSDMPPMAESDDEEAMEDKVPTTMTSRRQRARAIVKEDDEEEEEQQLVVEESITQVPSSMESPQKPAPFSDMQSAGLPIGLTQMFNSSMASEAIPSSLDGRSQPDAAFGGFGAQAPVMGLTQMFESSMASQETGPAAQNRMDILREDIPADLNISQIPLESVFKNTQAQTQGSLLDLNYSQSQIQYEPESLVDAMGSIPATQMSYVPDPTPDMGFQYDPADAPPRFQIPASQMTDSQTQFGGKGSIQSGLTEPTVILSPEEATPRLRKGRLTRKKRAETEDVDGSEQEIDEIERSLSTSEEPANAFNLLGKKKKKDKAQAEAYDKKKSNARNMFQEAAEESEDEYQGLGGNSDEEETDEEGLAEMEEMIDDDIKDDDERQHAELHLKRSVAEDEKNVAKMMKDIKHGNLRKRRGQGFGLDEDSEDEEEYRREKRRQKNAAERRRLLMMDENISKLADNRKREAFLKVIEESAAAEKSFLDDEEDYDFAVHEDTQNDDTQNNNVESPDQATDDQPAAADEAEKTEPGNPRRTGKKRKTKTSLEVQRTVSSLLDDGIDRYDPNASSDSDLEIEGYDNMNKRPRLNYIDRVAEKRSATTASESAKLAYQRGNTDPTGQFKVPTLLRRATTQSISETTTVAPKTAFVETTTKMKKAKAGGASFSYQYREAAKQKNIEKVSNDRRQEEKKVMGARRADAANVFNAGGFS
ncbi:hypothetical protein H072_6444 [Dactylellina haptotyla CBS 200.50]|uniref:DNA replication checkpoint mediator MRC1 domain-containing protein n=1 Tax=Dactylellina haptotyla (strain CBS 200.50) TaxID=1284197 RepID=S8AF56_DACHA|nr:hypothetical protein H072_6444 [Dactylellina haptotyla CBS 200.50]